jgi:hypothetical protein
VYTSVQEHKRPPPSLPLHRLGLSPPWPQTQKVGWPGRHFSLADCSHLLPQVGTDRSSPHYTLGPLSRCGEEIAKWPPIAVIKKMTPLDSPLSLYYIVVYCFFVFVFFPRCALRLNLLFIERFVALFGKVLETPIEILP